MKRIAKHTIKLGRGEEAETFAPGQSIDVNKTEEKQLDAAGALEPKAGKAVADDAPTKPRGKALIDAIAGAIKAIEPGNPEAFNQRGQPALAVLGSMLGYEINTAERDAAWEAVTKDNPDLFKSDK